MWSSFVQPLLRNWMELPPQVQVVLLLGVVLALWAARETYTTLLLILDELGVLNALDAIVGCCCPTRLWGRFKRHIEFAGMPKLEVATPVAGPLRSFQPMNAASASDAPEWRSSPGPAHSNDDEQQQQSRSQKPHSSERAAARAPTAVAEVPAPELEPLPDWCLTYDAATGGVDTVQALRQRRAQGSQAACGTEAEESSRPGALGDTLAGALDVSGSGPVGGTAATGQLDRLVTPPSTRATDARIPTHGLSAGSTPQGAGALPSPHTNGKSLPLIDSVAQSSDTCVAAPETCRQTVEKPRGEESGPAAAVAAVADSAAGTGGVQATCAAPASRMGCAVYERRPDSPPAGSLQAVQPG